MPLHTYSKRSPAKQPLPRGWTSLKPKDARNRSSTNPVNKEDNGFNHLSIPKPSLITHCSHIPSACPHFTNEAAKAEYLTLLRKRLQLTVSFLNLEHTHNLSPQRPFFAEPAVVALGQGPIPFGIYMLDLIRDLMDGRVELEEMGVHDPLSLRKETEKKVSEYVGVWKTMVGGLAEMVPERSEKVARGILEEVVGCAIVCADF
jgi:hypothetical protein